MRWGRKSNPTTCSNPLSASRTIKASTDSSAKCVAELVSAAGPDVVGVIALIDPTPSEARRTNSALRAHNLDERLAVVFRPDGTESKLYPATMRVLFEYDAEKARALVEDYGLPVDAQRERNLNRFIAHIGK